VLRAGNTGMLRWSGADQRDIARTGRPLPADHAAAEASQPVRYVSWSIFAAMMKSLRDKPSTVWVHSVTRTFPQVTVSSGVVELPFGEQRDPGGEPEGIPEVAEAEFSAEPTGAVSLPALIQVGVQRLGFVLGQRWGAFVVLDGMLLMQRPYLGRWSLLGGWGRCPDRDPRSTTSGQFWGDQYNDTVTTGH
jgi:hypothetical protein